MDIIEDNLLLIADATKGIQIVKPYALKVINLANEDTRAKMVKLVAYSLVKKGYGYNLYQ
jgi:ribosomal protein L14E/L6E/L27E